MKIERARGEREISPLGANSGDPREKEKENSCGNGLFNEAFFRPAGFSDSPLFWVKWILSIAGIDVYVYCLISRTISFLTDVVCVCMLDDNEMCIDAVLLARLWKYNEKVNISKWYVRKKFLRSEV